MLVAVVLVGVALVVERMIPPLDGALRVADGDSFDLGGARVRLEGIDAPELTQECGPPQALWPCGRRAREELADAAAGAEVQCRPVDEDRYGRAVSVCTAGGRDLGRAMVETVMAVATSLAYAGEARAARAARRGIWAGPFEMPADFRARQR